MKVAFACDHGGFPLKHKLVDTILSNGHEVIDFGTDSEVSVDYPDFVEKACRAVQQGIAERAILVCGSGIGACVTANKMKGISAGLCHDNYSAHQGVEHDDMNVLCLGARVIGIELAKEIVLTFLGAEFSKDARHVRRLKKMRKIEETQ